MKQPTHLHLVPRLRMVEQYLHSPICVHDVVLNKLSPGIAIPVKVKLKLSLYRPWRSLGLREVEAPTFSDIRLTDGGRVVSPMHQLLFAPRKIPGTHFC
jgi:hypothetical protein